MVCVAKYFASPLKQNTNLRIPEWAAGVWDAVTSLVAYYNIYLQQQQIWHWLMTTHQGYITYWLQHYSHGGIGSQRVTIVNAHYVWEWGT
jgi:hypothetical protein